MEFKNDDDEDIVDMNYLLAAANYEDNQGSPQVKQHAMSAKGPQNNIVNGHRSQSTKIMSPAQQY